VILLHGYFHDRREVLDHALYLHQAGYDVLLFDWRGHGASDATEATLGIREHQDLGAAVDEATRRSDGPIGVLGYSMGAGTAILYAADDPRIRALVLDSAYATIETSLDSAFTVLAEPKLPAFPFARVALLVGQLRTGLDAAELRPVERVAELSGRPLLFIVGADDTVLPPDETRRLFAAAEEPKALWEVVGASHPSSGRESFLIAPEQYRERVLATFGAGLR
jgi:pimeloyl-ACP methyl ester carboxylesterase